MTNLLLALMLATFVSGEEWSQFRGPNGSGVSATTGLPEEFGPTKNVVWKTTLPPGHSSPVLTKDRIFVTAFEKSSQQTANSRQQSGDNQRYAHRREQASPIEKENYTLQVICLDRQTGKLLWREYCPR